jgi:L-ascorbate 6-phosphate lactonase
MGMDSLATRIKNAIPPSGGFSVWFLGQNSFVLKGSDGFTVAIDPYLSDHCATRGKTSGPTPKSRLFPPPLLPSELSVDLVLLTHSHCDHADSETLEALAKNNRIRVAGSRDALRVAQDAGFQLERLRTLHPGEEVTFFRNPGVLAAAQRIRAGLGESGLTVWTTFALPTDGTDLNHVGFLLRFAGGATFWNTGDTAWCDTLPLLTGSGIRGALKSWNSSATGPDVMAVCINAGYGNLSHWDAARLAGAVQARYVVPCHWDLFPHNSLNPEPFRTSLEKNAPLGVYSLMEREKRYDFGKDGFGPA